jgi:phosphoribosylaminoimidazolecarboxamide formyltransferase/IMP cyclohydrolase
VSTPRYALISVSDKTDVAQIGRALVASGHTLLSTGGTAHTLRAAGLEVVDVAAHTGAPEIMNGRVKTLHPRVHGGILGDRGRHAEEAAAHDIPWVDAVVCNLYPFEKVTTGGADLVTAVETIDIGGPTMVRAAAKNFAHVLVVVDPSDYSRVSEALVAGTADAALRTELAVKAFRHTARYDAVIADWLARTTGAEPLPAETALPLRRLQSLRYGENPHQTAAFYADGDASGRSLARAVQHQGKPLSFNNVADLDGALRAVFEYATPAAAVIKHMNPCGLATAASLPLAFANALAGDPVSAYGGILAFNRVVDGDTVRAIKQSRTFFEVVSAPGFTDEARTLLEPRKKLRVIELPADWAGVRPPGTDARRVQGGWLLQDWDLGLDTEWTVATARAPTDAEERALRFAWSACRNVKSNAIVLARANDDGAQLNGVGAGQMSRVDAVHLAVRKATSAVQGCVLASDAFFPFPDGLVAAAEAGVTAVVQPGGSIRDEIVIAAADAANIAMVFTGARHFRH